MAANEIPEPQPAPPQPPTPPAASPGGLNLNKLLLFGGGGLLILLVIVIAAVLLLRGGGSSGPGSLLGAIPEETYNVVIVDLSEILRDEDFAEILGFSDDDLEYMELGDVELDTGDISEVVIASSPYGDLIVLKGDFQFDDVRDDLFDEGYDESSYRDYEVWGGWSYFALLERNGYIIFSESESTVERALNTIYRGEGSLADARNSGLRDVLNKLGNAPFLYAFGEGSCGLRRCQGYGVAFTEYDPNDEEAKAKFVVLFSSARAAESAAADYDEVSDLIERGASQISGYVEVADVKEDGPFVVGEGILEGP